MIISLILFKLIYWRSNKGIDILDTKDVNHLKINKRDLNHIFDIVQDGLLLMNKSIDTFYTKEVHLTKIDKRTDIFGTIV